MSDIFVSSARSTAAQAQTAAALLRALGYSVWIDDELPAHRAFKDVIAEELSAAKAVLVLWSRDAAKSDWVCSEAERARVDRKLVQLTMDGSPLPMPFEQIQCADLKGWGGDDDAPGWHKVLDSIRALTRSMPVLQMQATAEPRPSELLLAVLAFDNLSGDSEMAFFSDGVSEEIQQTVARGSELKVLGRGSSFRFRGAEKGAANVSAQLRATHVLDGSVRRSGTRVRISAQLIECAGETTLWSDRFDRELTDIFALQDEIATAVSAALKVTFARAIQPQSIDPSVYDMYLKARAMSHWTSDSDEDRVNTAHERLTMLDEVVKHAPGFARAWAVVAWHRAFYLRNFDRARYPGLNRASVIAAAEAALRLDPGLGLAYSALSRLEPWGRYLDRETKRRQAQAVAPNDPEVLTDLAWFCWDVGRFKEALTYVKRVWDLDPMDERAAHAYAATLEYMGRRVESRALWGDFCARWPTSAWPAVCAIGAAAQDADWETFDALVKGAAERGMRWPGLVDYWKNVRAPDPQHVERGLRSAREILSTGGAISLQTLTVLHRWGAVEQTFQLIEEASFDHLFDPDGPSPTPENFGMGVAVVFLPSNRVMIRDIRFVAFCAKLGLCDYWVKTDRWPDCAEDVPYDFRAEARRFVTQA